MKKIIAVTMLAVSLTACSSKSHRITEDDPRWNPRTMGNHCWGEDNPTQPGGIEIICDSLSAYSSYREAK
jgi:hypothetical protein